MDDDGFVAAHALAKELGVTACHTGAAGLAGMLRRRAEEPPAAGAPPDLVVLTGLDRQVA